MTVVFDRVVVLRAFINPQSRWGRLLARHADDYRLIVSPPIVAEYLNVLLRRELTRRFADLNPLPSASLFGVLAQAEVVLPTDVPSISRDSADDIFFALPGSVALPTSSARTRTSWSSGSTRVFWR